MPNVDFELYTLDRVVYVAVEGILKRDDESVFKLNPANSMTDVDQQHIIKSNSPLPQKKASRIPTRSTQAQRTKTEDKPYIGSSSQQTKTSITDTTKDSIPHKKSAQGQDKKEPPLHPLTGLAKKDSKENIEPGESKKQPHAAAAKKHNIKRCVREGPL